MADRTNADAVPAAARDDGHSDVLLVGGGLANALIALALAEYRPEIRVRILERAGRLGGNHTWSFHTTDVTPEEYRLIQPHLAATWPTQEVRFPRYVRVTDTPYNSVASETLAAAVERALPHSVITGAEVTEVGPESVSLADGRTFRAACVIDGRGAIPSPSLLLGYQKFVGLEVELERPHESPRPVIMDATVPQHDGYRFVYTLPFSPTHILIEDTYYSDTPDLDGAGLADRCFAYAAAKGWRIAREIRREQGVLPITLAGDIDRFWREGPQGACRAGMRAGLFHPTTGYSLPDAMHLAMRIKDLPEMTTASASAAAVALSRAAWRDRGFFRMLNRMLMIAAQGSERRDVLERFYTLPQGLVERFYAARLTSADKLRILMGRPPLPIGRAVGQLSESQALLHAARRDAALRPG